MSQMVASTKVFRSTCTSRSVSITDVLKLRDRDQPLIHFYNKCFLEKFDMDPKSEQAEDSKLDTQGVSIGGMANVRFHRCDYFFLLLQPTKA